MEVAKLLGGPILLVMNFIMITSAASTLDSTFTSFSKLAVVDLGVGNKGARPPSSAKAHRGARAQVQGKDNEAVVPDQLSGQLADTPISTSTVSMGRLAMIGITVLGTIPVFLNPAILSATTVSGAMVAGLAPVFCLWWVKAPPLSFWLSVGFGLLCGFVLVFGLWPGWLTVSTGKYADLLGVTLVEVVGCFSLYLLPVLSGRQP